MVTSATSNPHVRRVIASELDHLESALGDNVDIRAAIAAEYLRRGVVGVQTATECTLSERERVTLIRYALGHKNRAIAADLGIGIRTLETYLVRAKTKLELRGRAACVRWVIAQGWFA